MGDPISPTPDPATAPVVTGTTPAPTPAPEPEWPTKFMNEDGTKNESALLKSYTELEHKQSTPTPPAGVMIPDPAAAPAIDDNAGIDKILESAGLDTGDIGRQFRTEGKLTPANYTALKKANPAFTRGIVDQFMAMQLKVVEQTETALRAQAAQSVGGEEKLNTLIEWAKQLPESERKTCNTLLSNKDTLMMGVEWLTAKHKAAIGADKSTPLVTGQPAPPSGGGYANQTEMFTAMRNPLYETNKAYRADVNAKIAKTPTDIRKGRA